MRARNIGLAIFVLISIFTFAVYQHVAHAELTDIYWYNDGADNNWETLTDNWWLDAAHTEQAPSLPDINNNAVLLGTTPPAICLTEECASGTFEFPGKIDSSQITGFTITGSNLAVSSVIVGDVIFESAYYTGLLITGNPIFNGGGTNQGHIVGNVEFNNDAYNAASGVISGNATFYDTSFNEGVIEGMATFNSSSYNNAGSIGGDAVFVNDSSEFIGGEISGTKTRKYTVDTTTTRDFVTGGPWVVIADNSEVNIFNAIFDSDTSFVTEGDGEFIGGPSTFYWYNDGTDDEWTTLTDNWWLDAAHTEQADALPRYIDSVVILGPTPPHVNISEWMQPVSLDTTAAGNIYFSANGSACEAAINGLDIIGNATFDERVRFYNGTISGTATLTGSSYPCDPMGSGSGAAGTAGTVTFSNNASFHIGLNIGLDGEWNSDSTGWIFQGSKEWEFDNGSIVGGIVKGNVTMTNGSSNNGLIIGNAVLSTECFNYGDIQGDVIFNDAVHNSGTVTGDVIFNGGGSNFGTITGDVIFNLGYNEGTINGDAVFFGDTSDDYGVTNGTKTRKYIENKTTARNFVSNGPWTVIAVGVVVDRSGATYDNTTTFQAVDGGSFIPPIESASTPQSTPVLVGNVSGGSGYVFSAFPSSAFPMLVPQVINQPVTSPYTVPPALLTTNFSMGATHPLIKSLQTFLNSKGFIISKTGPGSPGMETTFFGSLTKAALARFQKANGLPATGYFGPLTRQVILMFQNKSQ